MTIMEISTNLTKHKTYSKRYIEVGSVPVICKPVNIRAKYRNYDTCT